MVPCFRINITFTSYFPYLSDKVGLWYSHLSAPTVSVSAPVHKLRTSTFILLAYPPYFEKKIKGGL
jgi:hypothetical protein